MRKLRMTVHNEGIQLQQLKFNSVSNASIVLFGDADLLTPQTHSILQQVPAPQQATSPAQTSVPPLVPGAPVTRD